MTTTKTRKRVVRKSTNGGAAPVNPNQKAFDDAADATIAIEIITPAIALKWLQDGPRPNRIITQARVNQYTREMLTARWRFNGDPVRFNKAGEVFDGQHRLWAIVESNATVPVLVIRNLPDDTIFVTDTGKPRNLSQFLSIMQEKDTSRLASSVTAHHRWLSTSTYNVLSPNMTPTIQDLLTVFEDHGDLLKKQLKATRALRPRRLGSQGLWSSILITLNGLSEEDAADFFNKFVTLEDLKENHPVMKLRKRIELARTVRGGLSQVDLAPLIIKAWNLYRAGKTVESLTYKGGGAFPEVYPVPA